jgi:flagellar P-ring protein precursor FlgI
MPRRTIFISACLLLSVAVTVFANPVRLKDLATLEGIRDNQLIGYGIVVGVNGTGDKSQTFFSAQTLTNLLEKMGVQVPTTGMLVRNTAAVVVTAILPPFAQTGTRIDVHVAAIGDATDLKGGMLVMTPLRGANGVAYAVAQGAVVTGGFVAGRGSQNGTTVNHPTAGRIPDGALVEQAAPSVMPGDKLRWLLSRADFTTAAHAAAALNQHFHTAVATCENSAVIVVDPPAEWKGRKVEFIAEAETVTLETDTRNRIVVNERTGTIVLGGEVVVRPVSILHGNLSVQIQTTFEVSQPGPLSGGQTAVVPKVDVTAKEEPARSLTLKKGATVDDLVKALTAIGSTARDIIAVLQNLRAAGALEAEIEVI